MMPIHRSPSSLALAVLLIACTPTRPIAEVDAIVRMKVADAYRLKPPGIGYQVEVELRNPANEARWLIWPVSPPNTREERPGARPVQALELYGSIGNAWCVIAAETNMRALRLPGRGTLIMKGRMSYDGVPESIRLEVFFATEVLVDGRSLESYFPELMTTRSGSTLELADLPEAGRWRAPDGGGHIDLTIESFSVREVVPSPL